MPIRTLVDAWLEKLCIQSIKLHKKAKRLILVCPGESAGNGDFFRWIKRISYREGWVDVRFESCRAANGRTFVIYSVTAIEKAVMTPSEEPASIRLAAVYFVYGDHVGIHLLIIGRADRKEENTE